MIATDVKIFVPAKNFEVSLAFYTSLGWRINWKNDNGLAELELANSRFYLQDYYVKQWAHNFMMYITIDNPDEWYSFISNEIKSDKRFKHCKVKEPKKEAYGNVVYVWDPSGVLLHFSAPIID